MSFSFSMLMYLNSNHTLSICAAVITIHSCVSFNQTLHLGILLFQGRIFSSNHSKYFNNENWKISINLNNNKCFWILLCCKCTISHKQSQDRSTVVVYMELNLSWDERCLERKKKRRTTGIYFLTSFMRFYYFMMFSLWCHVYTCITNKFWMGMH